LVSFYNHFGSKESYIDSFVTLDNIPTLVKTLGIEDPELEQMLIEPLRLHHEIKSENLAEAYLYFKGR
jgi:hypothetical protein